MLSTQAVIAKHNTKNPEDHTMEKIIGRLNEVLEFNRTYKKLLQDKTFTDSLSLAAYLDLAKDLGLMASNTILPKTSPL